MINNNIDNVLLNALQGKKIDRVESRGHRKSALVLDDGTELELFESEQDCCGIASGEWEILDPSRLEAMITNVRLECSSWDNGDSYGVEGVITILHNQNPIALANLHADAGNGGYYYSVLSLRVKIPSEDIHDYEVISSTDFS